MNEWPKDKLLDVATFLYKGRTFMMKLLPRGDVRAQYGITGYDIDHCPWCSKGMLLGRRNHTVTFDEQGRITAEPSLVCPHGCGWHVWLREGVATDC